MNTTTPHYKLIALSQNRRFFAVVTAAAMAIAIIGTAPATLSAATFSWTGDGTNDLFTTPGNWDLESGFPGSDDTAQFNLPGSTTVDFNTGATVTQFRYDGSSEEEPVRSLTLNLNGHTLTAASINYPGSTARNLTIDGGTFINNDSSAWRPNFDSTLESVLRLQNGAELYITSTGVAHLPGSGRLHTQVVEGSTLRYGSRFQLRGNSSLTVNGVGSLVTSDLTGSSSVLGIGVNGASGIMRIEAGALVDFGGNIRIAWFGTGSSGQLIVTGSGLDSEEEVVFSTVKTRSTSGNLTFGGEEATASTNAVGYGLFEFGGRSTIASVYVHGGSTIEFNQGFMQAGTLVNLYEDAKAIFWLHDTTQAAAIEAGNNLVIDSATFELVLGDGFSALIGDTFELATYGNRSGAGFANSTFSVDGYTFEIDYSLGDANVVGVVVTAIPEPAAVAFLVALTAFAAVIVIRRRRAS